MQPRCAEMMEEARSLAAGGEARGRVLSEKWRNFSYSPPSGYRGYNGHALVHRRLLEATEAQDLGAVWALWSEHCRMNPQEGDPDFLAFEIVMDAAVKAGRSDLVFHVLWPRAMALRMTPTPAMWFILLKAAAGKSTKFFPDAKNALGLGPDFAAELLNTLEREGLTSLDSRHYSVVISSFLGVHRYKKAFALYNKMRLQHLSPSPALFSTFFKKLRAAGKTRECISVWKAVQGAPTVAIPSSLYTLILQSFADKLLDKWCRQVIRRMRRKLDGRQTPSFEAVWALFDVYMKQERMAREELDKLDSLQSHMVNATTKSEKRKHESTARESQAKALLLYS